MEILSVLAREGWQIREKHFAPQISFAYPNQTKAVSVTGRQCELNCAHCGGHYLTGMKRLDDITHSHQLKASSLLISGGCTAEGRVPIAEHISRISALKQTMRYNIHVGLVSEEDISHIEAVADAVSFDFIGDDETIKEVLGIDRRVSDYIACYRKLQERCRVIPHICIGLHGGKIKGEYQVLKHLKALGASALTVIVFTPTKGTRFADCQPPPLEEVVKLLVTARRELPNTPIHLGCMRPGGLYRRQLDAWAVRCGLNSIVNPVREAAELAKELGLTARRQEECCVL